jgi:autotransporter passenger strand-loop-strand repeat protein
VLKVSLKTSTQGSGSGGFDYVIAGGSQGVLSSGTAIGATFRSGSTEYLSNGGTASGKTISSGGTQIAYFAATVVSGGGA